MNKKSQFWAVACCLTICMPAFAKAQNADFLGLFSGDELLGFENCTITESNLLLHTRHGQFSNFADDGISQAYSSILLNVYDDLADAAKEGGYGAVLNVRFSLSQSSDFVTEGGSTWRRGGKVFDAEGVAVAHASGDAVKVTCERK